MIGHISAVVWFTLVAVHLFIARENISSASELEVLLHDLSTPMSLGLMIVLVFVAFLLYLRTAIRSLFLNGSK